jgi:tripartite ATP-independent transporter DctM subunit
MEYHSRNNTDTSSWGATNLNNSRLIARLNGVVSLLDKTNRPIRSLNSIGMGIFFLMVCFVFADVFLRYLFNRPIAGSVEVTELMLVVIIFLGIPYTQLYKGHVSMDLITSLLQPRARVVMDTLTASLSTGLFILLALRSSVNVQWFMHTNAESGTLGIPYTPFAVLVPLSCTLLLLLLIRDLLCNILEGVKLHFGTSLWVLMFGLPILVIALMALWLQPTFWNISLFGVGVIGIAVCLLFFLTGMPIAFVLAMIGFLFLAHIRGLEAGLNMAGVALFRSTASFNWAVITFFVLMGYITFFAALGKDIYYSAYRWFGHLPGGLAIATVGAASAFAAVVGDTVSSTVTMAAVAMPEMKRYKYSDTLATGSIAAGGALGPIIPPSIGFILYGSLASQSIGDLFLAGIVPGILMTISFMIYIFIRCLRNPMFGPRGTRSGWRERIISIKAGGPILFLFALVIGGIYAGMFTPTEGGGIGAAGALIISLAMRRLSWKAFVGAFLDAGRVSAMILLILAGASMFGFFVSASRIPATLAGFVAGLPVPPLVTMTVILIVYLILGAVMPVVPMIIITIPIFFPLALALGFDPIWFGVLVVLMGSVGVLTPPFGINCFALKGVTKDIPISTIFRGVMPFVGCTLVTVILVLVFPPLATWLPRLFR